MLLDTIKLKYPQNVGPNVGLRAVNGFVCLFDWGLTPLSTKFHSYRGGQFYWWTKLEYLERTTNLGQVNDKPYHMQCDLKSTPFSMVQSHGRTHTV